MKLFINQGEQHCISWDKITVHEYGDCQNNDMEVNGAESVGDKTIFKQAVKLDKFLGDFFPLKKLL